MSTVRTTAARARRGTKTFRLLVAACVTMLATQLLVGATASAPLGERNFKTVVGADPQAAMPQGFGQRENTYAWAMQWFKGKLYVGTNRSWPCIERATWNREPALSWLFPYPPVEPDTVCPPTIADLAQTARAEIWQWTPGPNVGDAGTWQRVYQSPVDVPNPETPGRMVARDIAYRGMSVFTEPGGAEALYVSGMNTRSLFGIALAGQLPPPRLLRTTDGVTFQPLPQTPGTVLGNAQGNCFRGQETYQGKFYVVSCGIQGAGVVLAATDPKLGDNAFQQIDMTNQTHGEVFEIEPYNGYLYLGVHHLVDGYSVVRMKAESNGTYTFTEVVPPGALIPSDDRPNTDALSMFVFKGRLYVGGNGVPSSSPAEMLRVNPDDSWDVVHGRARQTTTGAWKYPLTSLDGGFGSFFNQHMWRMEAHDGQLFMGTFDSSTVWKGAALLRPLIQHLMGFDLFRTGDGWYFNPVTRDGFGVGPRQGTSLSPAPFTSFGARTMASTPFGLVVGAADNYYGLQIFRGTASADPPAGPPLPPARLEAEVDPATQQPVVSWLPVNGAVTYHVLRAPLRKETLLAIPVAFGQAAPRAAALTAEGGVPLAGRSVSGAADGLPPGLLQPVDAWFPLRYVPVAMVQGATAYADTSAPVASGQRYQYMVVAQDRWGRLSDPSNLVQVQASPVLSVPITFGRLELVALSLQQKGKFVSPDAAASTVGIIRAAGQQAQAGSYDTAAALLYGLRKQVVDGALLSPTVVVSESAPQGELLPLAGEDFEILTSKLLRRVTLVQAGKLSAPALFDPQTAGRLPAH